MLSLDPHGVELQLTFASPDSVSQEEAPDLILLQVELGEYKDLNGVNMPESVVKYSAFPRQIASAEEAQTVGEASATARWTAWSSVGGSVVVNTLIAGAMDEVWSLINSQQILIRLKLFNVKVPANAATFTEFIDEITSFQIFESVDEFVID